MTEKSELEAIRGEISRLQDYILPMTRAHITNQQELVGLRGALNDLKETVQELRALVATIAESAATAAEEARATNIKSADHERIHEDLKLRILPIIDKYEVTIQGLRHSIFVTRMAIGLSIAISLGAVTVTESGIVRMLLGGV